MPLIAIGLALSACLLAAPAANGFIYFTYGDTQPGIGRAENDGSGLQVEIVKNLGVGEDVASPVSDGHHLYWVNEDSDTIGRANLDGSKSRPNFISLPAYGGYTEIAVQGGSIYFTAGSSVGRAASDGSGSSETVIAGIKVERFAADSDHLYWSYGVPGPGHGETLSDIGRANLDGSGVDPTFIDSPDYGNAIYGLAVNDRHIFWATYRLGRANLDGSAVQPGFVHMEEDAGSTLAADSAHLYLPVGETYPYQPFIARINLDSLALDNPFIVADGYSQIDGIGVDGRTSPETKILKGPPKTTHDHNATISFKADQPRATFECQLDHGDFKRCDSPVSRRLPSGRHRFRVRAGTVAGSDPTPAVARWSIRRARSQ
jgi:hypothetical protein